MTTGASAYSQVAVGTAAILVGVVLSVFFLSSGFFIGPFFILGGAMTIWFGLRKRNQASMTQDM